MKQLLLLLSFFSILTFSQEKSNEFNLTHGIYAELWGPGGHGSLGYNLGLKYKSNLFTNIYTGVGGVYWKGTNPHGAITFPIGVSEEYKFFKFMSVEGGLFSTIYLNYSGTFTNVEKDCFGMSTCPPDQDIYFTGFLGVNFHLKNFAITPRMWVFFPNYWTNKLEFLPSISLRYVFNWKNLDE